ncbi:LINE-1 retrotransposable element ORF2 protein [Vitis vinifera]|uniref:LINE-1 retrotransposable element ORF2 protein n=1 Tax=Vitis vinifera TaxID=29760 RepID=A0A438JK40_VITVI|nr:LINE-1 retrotransposable element ORF2 protein [Vitis vinifera]
MLFFMLAPRGLEYLEIILFLDKMIRIQSVVVERKVFQVLERGDGLASGAVRESCGVGGFQGKVIVSLQEISVQAERDSKEKQKKPQESKGMYRGERTYADVVAEKELGMVQRCQLENGQELWKAQWIQERGSFTVRGEVFALRRWSPKENSVVNGKFRRGWLELRGLPFHLWDEVQLRHILQQWGRVTKVARKSLKFVDLSKVTLRVEMLPNVVLPALLEVEDGEWTYMVAVIVTGEDDGGDSIRPESNRGKDELRSAGGCVLQKPQIVEGLRAIDRTIDCHSWMPRHRSILVLQIQNRLRGERKGKVFFKCRQTKGSPVSVRRRARSGPPSFEEASSSPKRSFEGGGSLEQIETLLGANLTPERAISPLLYLSKIFLSLGLLSQILFPKPLFLLVHPFRYHSSSSFPLESSYAFQSGSVFISPVVNDNLRGGAPVRKVEGLTPRKMVKVQSVLESLRVRIVRIMGKGVEGENRSALSADKILSWNTRGLGSRKKRRTMRRFLSSQNPDVVMLQETKREIWDRRLVSSVWKVYGPNKAVWRKDFWMELQDLHGLTFPRWCVGGDFNVIRRISEKMGDSRFENKWLFHPEFKEKCRDWWQECTVEGWEGHKFMRKLKFIKSKLKEWNTRVFGDLRERKKHILMDLGRIDRIEQEGNLNLDLVSERTLRRKELEDFLLKEEEVRMTVFQLNKEKAPGPDDFTIAVYQECWDVIKEDLMRVFFEFHTKGVLSGRLRKVLHETIFGSQGAFVEGRQILDAVLIANEVVDGKRRKGFSQKWKSWMRGCLSSSSFAILVNGNAKGWVKASGGLRQGDPLSPFLFTLVADVLSRLMIRAEETGITEGFLVGRDRTRVSLLQFADDTIFFSKASLDLLQNLKIILLVFGQVSGLKINLEKSTISGINTRQEMLSSLALVLECRVSEWPLSYLGLSLGGNPKTIGFWDPVVERISRRLDGWKKAYLSLGGRITLIQSCLSHIPSYFLSLFKIPVSIASKIEKMQRDFLWSGAEKGKRDHLIRWEVVSRPREMGGLGFGKTSMRNNALLGKWLWRFPRERSGLWHKVIASIYGTHPNGWDANMVVRWSHRCPWKAIAQVFQEFSPFVRLVNFNFRRNLTDSEIDLLQRLMSSLHSVLLSPSSSDSRAWSLSSSGSFSVKSFFYALSKDSNPLVFLPAKFLWSSKVPSKVKALAWLVAHGKVFNLVVVIWVPPRSIEDMNNRIFEDKGRTEEMVWDLIRFYSSLWASCTEALEEFL